MNNGKVKLSWSTQSEKNNNGFEIEKRVGNENWKTIGFIKGIGTATEISRYSFIDESKDNSSKSVLYKLKQIDFDGSYNYSKEIEIDFGKPGSFQLYQNYPNPFNPETNIKYEIMNNQFVTLKIYDSLGQEVKTLINEEHEAGYYTRQFSGSDLNASSGIYYYQLRAGDYINTKKMTLIK
jgi:hypothetical protein